MRRMIPTLLIAWLVVIGFAPLSATSVRANCDYNGDTPSNYSVFELSFSPDDKFLLASHYPAFAYDDPDSYDFRVSMWDLASQTLLHEFETSGASYKGMWFSHAGTYIFAGSTPVRAYFALTGRSAPPTVATARDLHTPAHEPGSVYAVEGTALVRKRFGNVTPIAAQRSPDGSSVYLLDATPTFHVYDAERNSELGAVALKLNALSATAKVFIAENGQAALIFDNNRLQWVDLITGLAMPGYGPTFEPLAISPDGRSYAVAEENANADLLIRDSATGKELKTLPGNCDTSTAAAFSCNGQFLAAGDSTSGDLRVWDIATGQQIALLNEHADVIEAADMSPDSRWVATGGPDSIIRLWDARDGSFVNTLRGHIDTVSALAFSPDGTRLASGGYQGEAKLWDVATGRDLRGIYTGIRAVSEIAFSPDGMLVALGGGEYGPYESFDQDSNVLLWHVQNGDVRQRLKTGDVYGLQFVPNSTKLLIVHSSGQTPLIVWDYQTGSVTSPLAVADNMDINVVAVSPDGKYLATGSPFRLWDMVTGTMLYDAVQDKRFTQGKPDWFTYVVGIAFTGDRDMVYFRDVFQGLYRLVYRTPMPETRFPITAGFGLSEYHSNDVFRLSADGRLLLTTNVDD